MSAIIMPWPPSLNTYWRNVAGRTLISAAGRQYRMACQALAYADNWPRFGAARLSVRIEAWVPDKRRRDLDNMVKAPLDSLTHAGVWDDDSQIDELLIRRGPIGGMLKVWIEAAT
jgi:crossover junction endodeoxyribonuclease RusA